MQMRLQGWDCTRYSPKTDADLQLRSLRGALACYVCFVEILGHCWVQKYNLTEKEQ